MVRTVVIFVFLTQNTLQRRTVKVVLASSPKVPRVLWSNVTRVHAVALSTDTCQNCCWFFIDV